MEVEISDIKKLLERSIQQEFKYQEKEKRDQKKKDKEYQDI